MVPDQHYSITLTFAPKMIWFLSKYYILSDDRTIIICVPHLSCISELREYPSLPQILISCFVDFFLNIYRNSSICGDLDLLLKVIEVCDKGCKSKADSSPFLSSFVWTLQCCNVHYSSIHLHQMATLSGLVIIIHQMVTLSGLVVIIHQIWMNDPQIKEYKKTKNKKNWWLMKEIFAGFFTIDQFWGL